MVALVPSQVGIAQTPEQDALEAISSDWLQFKLSHEEDSVSPEDIKNWSGKVITSTSTPSSPITLSGTIGTTWTANPGWCTNAGAMHWIHTSSPADAKTDLIDFFDLSTLTDGGLLVVFDLYFGTSNGGTDTVFSASRSSNGTRGGYTAYINSNRIHFGIYMKGGTALIDCYPQTLSPDTHYQVAFYIDVTNNLISSYINGVAGTGTPATRTLDDEFPTSSYPSLDASRGIVLLAKDTGGGSVNTKLGSAGVTHRVSDLSLFRITDDKSADIPVLVNDIYKAGWHRLGNSVGDL